MSKNSVKKVNIIINIVAIILLVALFVGLFIYFYDDIVKLNTKEGLEAFILTLQNTGFLGAVILILIQTLQVVVVFIPGEFVELASGVMFGPVFGLFICLLGLNLGTMVIWGLVKLLGRPFVDSNIGDSINKLEFLNEPNRALVILFFIFLIPGIPKDILIYPIPLTRVNMFKFMIVSSIARIPSVVSSTFIGNSLVNQNYVAGIVVMVISL
ncbi:MAG: TVP38/TMEM64 family protein, partial [Clostridia bacterium]|nr:TVP38/TMEM64 family protein [Clostridia bacterium]